MERVVSICGLNHFFGDGTGRRQTLFDVSMEILPGEIMILTGPSGSGKTTLLTLIGGLRSVQEGSVVTLDMELRGASPVELAGLRKDIGFIFQAHNLLSALTSCQNVQLSAQLDQTHEKHETRQRCIDVLASVGLQDHLDSYPQQLSGGQRQRVAIARALVRAPKIILADEPTAALDKKSGREVVELLHAQAKRKGCAVVLVTHDNRILDIADRILTLEDGRISSSSSGLLANTEHLLKAFMKIQRKGDLRRHVTQMTDTQFMEMLEAVSSEFEQVLRTFDVINREASDALVDEILEAVTLKIRKLMRAERATIYLVDEQNQLLHSKFAQHDGTKSLEISLPVGVGIAGTVAATGELLNVSDPYSHPAFYAEIDRQTAFQTHSILCVPMLDREERIFAVAQFLNQEDGKFTSSDENRFQVFAKPLALILETCKGFKNRDPNAQTATEGHAEGN